MFASKSVDCACAVLRDRSERVSFTPSYSTPGLALTPFLSRGMAISLKRPYRL